jgi:amidase
MAATLTEPDLAFSGIARQAELIRDGEVTARELTELSLARIERHDSDLNAFRVVMAERALAEADQADARRGDGDERPLLGVPVAVKDCFDVAGESTPNGSNATDPAPVENDAEITRRLRAAGAVVIGKTHVPELCITPFTETAAFGTTRNPWNRDHSPGGSSGGSAAAVAAGLVGAAVASDGAGSIRIPAACCGLFGLKPQRGRVSLSPWAEHWNGMSVAASVTRRVADSALFLDVVAGPGPNDNHSAPAPETPFAEAAATSPGRLRIAVAAGLPPDLWYAKIGDEMAQAVADMAATLRGLGHEVAERELDYGHIGNEVTVRYLRGIADDVDALPHPERAERRTQATARLARMIPDRVYRSMREAEAATRSRIGAIFGDFDVVLTPALARPAMRIGELQGRGALWTLINDVRFTPLTPAWNVTGWPAAAVPAGLSKSGLPLAVQLLGRENDEATLISLSAQLEAELGWPDQRPPGF